MASQDDTPQQLPTTGGPAETGRDRAETGAGDALSDASETIVSGDHATGTGAQEKLPASAAVEGSGSTAADTGVAADSPASDDGLGHDDWDAAFADAAGTPAETAALRTDTAATGNAAGADTDVVPGGHPSLAQRSSLPMRRASTLPDLSGYGELSEAEQKAAGDINAEMPAGLHASAAAAPAGKSAAAQKTAAAETPSAANTPAETAAAAAPGTGTSATDASPPAAAAGAGAVSGAAVSGAAVSGAAGSGATGSSAAGSSAAGSGSADAPATALIDTSAKAAPSAAAGAHSAGTKSADTHSADAKSAGALSGKEGADPAADDEISEEEARRRAEERERAGTAKPILARILQVMIAVFFPVMLLAAAIRAVATPVFLWVEYHRPGFPSDGYGFSTDDRMTYGSYAVDYLLNFSGSRYLGDLVTAGGEPLYLESEVSHMADVKTVLTIAFVSALVMAFLSLLACIYLAKRSPGGIRRALFSGAVLTLVLVGALIVTAVLGWESFFTQVHTIFFANGNWTFRMDDTLIRLFPAQFWMDAGIAIAGLVLLTCIVVLICAWPTKARRERARIKQEAARRRYLDSLEAV